MPTQPNKHTAKEIDEVKKLLQSARNRYDNKVLEIERVWAKLPPHDYAKRRLITGLTESMLEIDKSIKEWEEKIQE
ncbi:MAG: hypothetical protein WAV40_00855 [Microgenomates group bacterium]